MYWNNLAHAVHITGYGHAAEEIDQQAGGPLLQEENKTASKVETSGGLGKSGGS